MVVMNDTKTYTYLAETLGLDVQIVEGISKKGNTHIGTEEKTVGQYLGLIATGQVNGKEIEVSVTLEVIFGSNNEPKIDNASYVLVNNPTVEMPLGKNTYKVTDLHWLI